MQRIQKYTNFFDLAIVADDISLAILSKTLKPYFKSVKSLSFESLSSHATHAHLLFMFGSTRQMVLSKTNISHISRLDAVVFSDDDVDDEILEELLLMRVAHIAKHSMEAGEISGAVLKILPILIKKYNESLLHAHHKNAIEHASSFYMIEKNSKAIYANSRLKSFFATPTLLEINKSDIGAQFIQGDGITLSSNGASLRVNVKITELEKDEKLIEAVMQNESSDSSQLLNRITFIEALKDSFVIHKAEHESVLVVVMAIDNQLKIIEEFGENSYNDTCKTLLNLAKKHFGEASHIALWHKDLFALVSEGSSGEELKSSLERLHETVLSHVYEKNIIPILNSFVLDFKNSDLNDAIYMIDNIRSGKLLAKDLTAIVTHEVAYDKKSATLRDQALHYLEQLFLSKSQIKLLNFYKGIRINTLGQIIKVHGNLIYIKMEKIQGYAMQLEGVVVIQATNLPFDIESEIRLVDIEKKIAVLHNFEPLKVSANSRKHIRIQSDHRMHITISGKKHVVSATVIDLSMTSIACSVKNINHPLQKGDLVNLQFRLPSKHNPQDGIAMNITGVIEFIFNATDYAKVIVLLDLEEPYENFLIEYIYARQQELILELKNIVMKL